MTPPEILRSSLLSAVLQLKSLPLQVDVLSFDFLDKPTTESLQDALRQLFVIGAINCDGAITARGRLMATLPLDPSLAAAALAAADLGCLQDLLTVAAMLSADAIFAGGRGPEQLVRGDQDRHGRASGAITAEGRAALADAMSEGLGDHIMMLRLYQKWEATGFCQRWARECGLDVRGMRFASEVRRQLEAATGARGEFLRTVGSGQGGFTEGKRLKRGSHREKSNGRLAADHNSRAGTATGRNGSDHRHLGMRTLRQALATGFANRLARRLERHNGYKTTGNHPTLAKVHPTAARVTPDEDGLLPEWLLYTELVSTAHTFLRTVCPVDNEVASQIMPLLRDIDVYRLSGVAAMEPAAAAATMQPGQLITGSASVPGARKHTATSVEDARSRYLARKRSRGGG